METKCKLMILAVVSLLSLETANAITYQRRYNVNGLMKSESFNYAKTEDVIRYPIVGTNVQDYYSDNAKINKVEQNQPFYGQDANYYNTPTSYTDNGDGTITDNVTGLMWQKDMGEKITQAEAIDKANNMTLGGYSDWRIPTIKELYSLIIFTGQVKGETAIIPFIDTNYFIQPIGDLSEGEREIDAQTWSSTKYTGHCINGEEVAFGVNFIDGRIKGYSLIKRSTGEASKMYFRMVRGNQDYGKNNFIDNNDGTITDLATGLMWQKTDDGISRNWEEALSYCENLSLAGHDDWRIPNCKELQSIVDYSRSPEFTNSAAINPIFDISTITDFEGNTGQYPYFWTGTTHLDGANPYTTAVYIAFGKALGYMNGVLTDVHGAGAQRSDPKFGNKDVYPTSFGPQGDIRMVYNSVRAVRFCNEKPIINQNYTSWRFAVIGDTHVPSSSVIDEIVPLLLKDTIEVAVFVGDIIQGGKGQNLEGMKTEIDKWMESTAPLRDAGIKVLCIRGNHEADIKGNNLQIWRKYFGDENFLYNYKNVSFIGLDNYEKGTETVDVDTLRTLLSQSPKGAIIVPFGHEPAFTNYTFHPTCLDANKENRDEFWSIIEDANVSYYFCGHAHMFNESTITNKKGTIVQIVSGGGGGNLQDPRTVGNETDYEISLITSKSENGYVLVNVANNQIIPNWIKVETLNSINQIGVNKTLKLYPNPVSVGETINIELMPCNNCTINLFNEEGKRIKYSKIKNCNGIIQLQTNELSPGIYILRIKSDNYVESQKFIVVK